MEELANQKIKPYGKDEKPLSEEKVKDLLPSLPGWRIVERESIPRLEKSFQFPNFQEALDFANLVGEKAEGADHHPAISVSWGQTAVSWWTHAVTGLHVNDFIMASRTELIYQEHFPPDSSREG